MNNNENTASVNDDRQAEKSLPGAHENPWRFAMESVGDGLWEWHIPERKLTFSPDWQKMLGYAQDEIGATLDDWERLVHPDDLAGCRADFNRYLKGETPLYRNEHRIRAKNGDYRWFLDRGKIMARGDGGEPLRVIGSSTEITDKKALEQDLAAKEAHYRSVLDTMVDGVIVIDVGGVIQSVNPSVERIFGYRAEELVGKTINLLMPEPYRSHHDRYIQRYVETGQAHIIGYGREATGLRKDGTTFPVDLAISQMMIEGRHYFTGILRDITKRKRSEIASQLATSTYGAEAVLIADADNCIITVNKQFTELTGYELHEVIGQNPRILSSGRQDKTFYDTMWQALGTAGHWQGRLWNRRKNGQDYLESLSISVMYDDNGDVFRYVAVFSEVAAAA